MKRLLLPLVVVAAAFAAAAAIFDRPGAEPVVVAQARAAAADASNQPAAQPGKTPTSLVAVPGQIPDYVLGRPDAPVTIIEYSSLTCPHCATFHAKTLPRIKSEWIDTGKAKLVYRDFPFDGLALGAAMLARCGGPEKYFGLLETLFASQGQWARSDNPMMALQRIAMLAGIPQAEFQQCISDQATLAGIKAKQQAAQKEYGIESTPSFVIDGALVTGAQPYEVFEKALQKAAK